MRVTGGMMAGRVLLAPSGRGTRPTPSLVRGAMFAALAARLGQAGPQPLAGWRVLDLFAGTGALGIEALSRGADAAWFVESAAPALRALRANLAALDLGARGRVVPTTAARLLRDPQLAAFGPRLILADPPYRLGVAATLAQIAGAAFVPPDAFVILQHPGGEDLPARSGTLTRVWERAYGVTQVSMFEFAQ